MGDCDAARAASASGAALEGCQARRIAEVPIRDDYGFLSTPVTLDGKTVSLIVDTGSEGSLISPAFARDRGLPPDPSARTRLSGTGGEGVIVPNVVVRSLMLGPMHELGPASVPMGPLPGRPNINPPVEGLLGGDLLSRAVGGVTGAAFGAIEIDVAGGTMTLWHGVRTQQGGRDVSCAATPPSIGQESQAHGSVVRGGAWHVLPATLHGHRFTLDVQLDGHTMTALLDSGARSRIVSSSVARAIGVSDEALAIDPGGETAGVDGRRSLYRWHRFHSLTIGPETERMPVLTVARLSEPVDILLGSDWFATHRVWLSYGDGRVFVAESDRGHRGK